MKTLTSSASKINIDKCNNKDRGFLSSKGFHSCMNPDSLLLPPKKLVDNAWFLQHKAGHLLPISALSSSDAQMQAELEETVARTSSIYESKTMRVKFQLQKECLFGEQFLLVGDDPVLGLWDPESAIPLDWSDEHVWTVELDLHVGKTIQFKFMLRDSTGEILWQPGPDRTFQTWETENTVMVFEDWDDAEEQKIIEKTVANENMKTNEDVIRNNGSAATLNDLAAPNNPKKHPVSNASKRMLDKKKFSQSAEEPAVNKNKTTKDALGNDSRAATVENLTSTDNKGNLFTHQGDAVLVPGLTPLPREDEEKIEDGDQKSTFNESSVGTREAMNYNLPESDGKQEHDGDDCTEKYEIFKSEEPQLDGEQGDQPDAQLSESNVIRNDIQWGRRTLQTLLTNLGLL